MVKVAKMRDWPLFSDGALLMFPRYSTDWSVSRAQVEPFFKETLQFLIPAARPRTVPKFPKLKTATYRLHKENEHSPVTTEEFQGVKG